MVNRTGFRSLNRVGGGARPAAFSIGLVVVAGMSIGTLFTLFRAARGLCRDLQPITGPMQPRGEARKSRNSISAPKAVSRPNLDGP